MSFVWATTIPWATNCGGLTGTAESLVKVGVFLICAAAFSGLIGLFYAHGYRRGFALAVLCTLGAYVIVFHTIISSFAVNCPAN